MYDPYIKLKLLRLWYRGTPEQKAIVVAIVQRLKETEKKS